MTGDTEQQAPEKWLVLFEDPDKGIASFQTEVGARQYFARAVPNWTCMLLAPASVVDEERAQLAAAQAENERLRSIFQPIEARARKELELGAMPALLDESNRGATRLAQIIVAWSEALAEIERLKLQRGGYADSFAGQDAEIAALRQRLEQSDAELDVIAERHRQIEKEGWSADHDDSHTENDLARAALAYVGHYVRRSWRFHVEAADYSGAEAPADWPWDGPEWKPKNPRRDLVRAAALIIAELDRLDRNNAALAAEPAAGQEGK